MQSTQSTAQAMQAIAKAEAQARDQLDNARSMFAEEESASLRKEEERLQQKKKHLKEENDAMIRQEEEKAARALDAGLIEVAKEKDALRGRYDRHKGPVITRLVQQFFTPAA